MRCLATGMLMLTALIATAAVQAGEFPLKDFDVWVMAGDSITAQHLHSNYFEAFCYARYPKLMFAFRNSGVGGHTIPTTLARFDYDIAAWKPTVISVELGMNDSGGTPTTKFIENMGTMVERIRKQGARPVILSASPVNDGTTTAKLAGRNIRLDEYATALKSFCEKEKLPYADQFHALVDIWGKNKPRELISPHLSSLQLLATLDALEGVEHLRSFLAIQNKDTEPRVSMQGDPVHPGPPGQLMMAASLLKALGAEPFVSSVTIDFAAAATDSTKAITSKGCETSNFSRSAMGELAFDRLDECLPFPIPESARAVLPLAPDVLALSQYLLTVQNLPAGKYELKLNGVVCAIFTEKQLGAGVNLTEIPPVPAQRVTLRTTDRQPRPPVNPITEQSQLILDAVKSKEELVSRWRGLSRQAHTPRVNEGLLEQLATLKIRVEEADAIIRAEATPRKLHFEIGPKK